MRLIRDQRDNGAFQPDVIEHAGQPAIVRLVRRIEHRHFDPVKAGRLERAQHGHMFLGHVPGPQQHVHADFHGVSLLRLAFESQTAPKMKNSATGITAIA